VLKSICASGQITACTLDYFQGWAQ